MNPQPDSFSDGTQQAAAEWIVRLDRGLSAAEQDEYSQWLASSPLHREAITHLRWGWEELDRLAGLEVSSLSTPNPDLLLPIKSKRVSKPLIWIAPLAFAAAAVLIAAVLVYIKHPAQVPSTTVVSAPVTPVKADAYERRLLDDGSVVELNRGALVSVEFTPAERHVRLVQGEANFTVAKNPARPFTVEAFGVVVQAVGTVFNVRIDGESIDVLVSEGTVKVRPETLLGTSAGAKAEPVYVKAGQRALVAWVGGQIQAKLFNITADQLGERLAWQPRVLDFDDAPLTQIVSSFNAHNTVKLEVGDTALNNLRLSVTFRSDNIDGFLRLMDADFDIRAERRGDHLIVLFKK